MRRRFKPAVIILLVLLICLSLSGCEEFKEQAKYILAKPIEFACGKFSPGVEDLSLTVNADELPLLDGFERLRSVDFNNSLCYGEISAWAEAHPEIEVRCAYPLPNGDTVQLMIDRLDLSGLRHDQAAPMAEALSLLPKLQSVELGKASGFADDLTLEDVAYLRELNPGVHFNADAYSFEVLGQRVSLTGKELDLSAISSEDMDTALELISLMPALEYINLGKEGGGLSWEDILTFQRLFPELELDYEFTLYGQTFDIDVETMDFSFQPITDNGASLKKVLPYLLRCTYVDMDSCGISSENMGKLQAEFPNVKLVWRVFFGPNYTLRTDAERLLASKPSVGTNLTAKDLVDLKYCTDLKYLDLGHNETIEDVSFLKYLPKLEVVILAMNSYFDISALENCHNIEYLEIYDTNVDSVEALKGMTKLRHLNIGLTKVTDISPLYELDLERLWIGCYTPVPKDQVAKMQELHPDCHIDTGVTDPSDGYWRYGKIDCWPWVYNDRYLLLREQMGYDELAYNFTWDDEEYMAHFG